MLLHFCVQKDRSKVNSGDKRVSSGEDSLSIPEGTSGSIAYPSRSLPGGSRPGSSSGQRDAAQHESQEELARVSAQQCPRSLCEGMGLANIAMYASFATRLNWNSKLAVRKTKGSLIMFRHSVTSSPLSPSSSVWPSSEVGGCHRLDRRHASTSCKHSKRLARDRRMARSAQDSPSAQLCQRIFLGEPKAVRLLP